MSRVLLPDGALWYDELKAVSYYGESELERFINHHVASLFPDFYVFPFKRDVSSRTTGANKRPDLGMVRRDYSAWGIVEVELAEHSLDHILDQVSCFADGEYNAPDTAAYIRSKIRLYCHKRTSLSKLTRLIEDQLPRVFVLADSHVEAWEAPLKRFGASLCVFQIFKNTRGKYLFRTLGSYPVVPVRDAHCRRHAMIPNLLEIVGTFTFTRLGSAKQVEVMYDKSLTRWTLLEDAGKRYLRFVGQTNPLSPNATYRLFADRLGRYYFEVN